MDTFCLEHTTLFHGAAPREIENMLKCLNARKKTYQKDNTIYHAGETVHRPGLILSGSVSIENSDFWGNRSILDKLVPGDIFAEAYACIAKEPLMINVVASEETSILFLDIDKILRTCPKNCPHHTLVIQNLLTVSAQKNIVLSRRIFHTAPKSIRGRLLSYLSFQAECHGSHSFTIPFNRQQLADYLNVDRSALSNELGKMQKDGLITVRKNHFILHKSIYPQ